MAPSRRDKGKGKVIDDSTGPEPDMPDRLNLRSLAPTPKEKIDFMLLFRNHSLTTPKYGNLSSFPFSSFDFPELLNHQGLGILLSDFGPYFCQFSTKFYYNLSIWNGCIVKSCVKGIYIIISMEDFNRCLDVPFDGERICQGFTCDWNSYQKNRYYYNISRLTQQEIYNKRARNDGSAPNRQNVIIIKSAAN